MNPRPQDRQPIHHRHPRMVLLPALAALASAGFLVLAPVSSAATASPVISQATAQALKVTNQGIPLFATTPRTATNDGTTMTTTGSPTGASPGPPIFGTPAVLPQGAVANPDGTSAACAGLLGAGGTITVDSTGSCTVTNGSGGVSVNLGNGLVLRAASVVESCTANGNGATSAQVNLVGAQIGTNGPFGFIPLLSLPSSSPPNTVITVPGPSGSTVTINEQSSATAGAISATALSTAGSGSPNLSIGHVTCGPNQVPAPPTTTTTTATTSPPATTTTTTTTSPSTTPPSTSPPSITSPPGPAGPAVPSAPAPAIILPTAAPASASAPAPAPVPAAAAQPPLAYTGVDALPLVVGAAILLMVGLALVLLAGRRSRRLQ